jgi:DNA helicase-2/ATP-dependent DNA helicase PcrA
LLLHAVSVLREDEVDESLVPDGVLASARSHFELLRDKAHFDYTELINLAVQSSRTTRTTHAPPSQMP